MESNEIIETTILVKPKKFILFIAIFIAGGTTLTMYLFLKLHYFFMLFIGFPITFLSPFIFAKRFRKNFSQNVSVNFSPNAFSIEFKDPLTDEIIRKDINRFSEISFFKPGESTNNDFSTLKLFFKDGTKLKYTFSEQKNNDICETDINWLFKKSVDIYNFSRKQEDKIKINPSFFSTKIALYLGIIITVGMALFTLYYGIQKPKTLFVSIGFIVIYLQMVAARKKAIKEKNNFS